MVKSLISLFNRPFIFLQTFFPGELSSLSSSELSLSAINRSTQPSGSGDRWPAFRATSVRVIRLEGFLGIGLSEGVRRGGGRDDDDDGIVGRDEYRPDLCEEAEECPPDPRSQGGSSGITGNYVYKLATILKWWRCGGAVHYNHQTRVLSHRQRYVHLQH